MPQQTGLSGVYKQIELAGRTSYKSENRITEDSAEKFVNMLIDRGHLTPLEFGTIYLQMPTNIDPKIISFYDDNPYSRTNFDDEWYYVTTNARVIVENNAQDDLKYLCEPTARHANRITARIVCSRGVGNEITRHRAFSFVQESTRYCNYSKDKFNGEITFIIPSWMFVKEGWYYPPYYNVLDDKYHIDFLSETEPEQNLIFGKDIPYKYQTYIKQLSESEFSYFHLLNAEQLTPQEARGILPLDLKTEIVMCGYKSDWEHFFALRTAKDAHPDMQIIANELQEKFPNYCH